VDRPIAVVGLMGAGKTTFGRALAERLARPFSDSDVEIEAETGRSAAEILIAEGEVELHRLERDSLVEALARRPPEVVAVAAGALDEARQRAALDRAFVVWLDAPPEVLAGRFRSRPGRPVYGDPIEVLRRHDAARRPHLEALADVVLDATASTDDQVATVVTALPPG
jgi:shikimate kinase